MAEQLPVLNDKLTAFIQVQHMFFVATAAAEGRINLSPKGMDCLRILSPEQLIWLNATGSGNETAGHLLQSNRMTLMFCSFDKQPLILRLYGSATTVHQRDAKWEQYASQLPRLAGARQIFVMNIDMVQTSCGFAVPYFDFVGDRPALLNWAQGKDEAGMQDYWKLKNQLTLDGHPTHILEAAKVPE